MLLDDDVVAERQAEPGALARRLGGEERIDRTRQPPGGWAALTCTTPCAWPRVSC